MAQNSRNILLDVVFAKDSLTRISSADMREFVNYVYDELMDKTNIADSLDNQSSSVTLSAKQGYALKILNEDTNKRIDNTESNIKIHASEIDNNSKGIIKNSDDISSVNILITNLNKDILDTLTKYSYLESEIVKTKTLADNTFVYATSIEEKLTKTNGINDKITKTENDIIDNKKEINKFLGDINNVYTEIKSNTNRIVTIDTNISDINKRVLTLDKNINTVNNLADDSMKLANENQVDIRGTGGVNEKMAQAQSDISHILGVLNKDDTNISDITDDIKINTDAIKEINIVNLPDIDKRIYDLDERVKLSLKTLVSQVSGFQQEITANTKAIGIANTGIIGLQTAISNQNTNFSQINKNIISIETNISAIQKWETTLLSSEQMIQKALQDISTNAGSIANNKNNIDAGIHLQNQINNRLNTLETSQNVQDQDIKQQSGAIVSIQNANTSISNDLVTLKSDHVTFGSNLTNTLSKVNKLATDVLMTDKAVDDNKKEIQKNKVDINVGVTNTAKNKSDLLALEADHITTKSKVSTLDTNQIQQRTDINQNAGDIQHLSTNFMFPGLNAQSVNDQIVIRSKPGAGDNLKIKAMDAQTEVWSISSEGANKDKVQVTAKTITLSTDTIFDLKQLAKDPNNITNQKEYNVLAYPTSYQTGLNKDDFIIYSGKEWVVKPFNTVHQWLDVDTTSGVDNKITAAWTANIADFKTHYLDANYYKKAEVLTKVESHDALVYRIQNTKLIDLGAAFSSTSSQEFKDWEKLRNFSPQPAINDLHVPQAGQGQIDENNTVELYNTINTLIGLLRQTGVFN